MKLQAAINNLSARSARDLQSEQMEFASHLASSITSSLASSLASSITSVLLKDTDLADKLADSVTSVIVDELEKRHQSFTAQLASLEQSVSSLDVSPVIEAPRVDPPDLSPIMAAIKSIKVDQIDLGPVLRAIQNIKIDPVDINPLMDAINGIELPAPESKPTYWRLVHHRDARGRITETEAFAD